MKYAVLLIALFPVAALAQQQQTPIEQALTGKLQEEYGQNIQLRAALIQAQKEVADLKAKYEPPKVEPKK